MPAAFKSISVLITGDASSLRSQLHLAAREVEGFSRKVEAGNAGALSSSKLMAAGFAAAGVAVAAGLAFAVKGATEFESRMRNVNSISGLSEGALKSLGGEVLDLSRKLPQSANNLAEGLYDIASSGFQGAEGLKVLEAAAVAASAGLTDTATSGKAITAVLNAYGLGASQATDVSDTLFQTVNLGVVSFGELSSVIGDVIGIAAQAGVSIDQVGAAIATMTLAGISGAESATSLNRLIQAIIQPSDQLSLVLKQVGYESGAQALRVDGLHKVMEKLRVATGGNVESLLQLFPEIRAARGAMALMAKEGENYNRVAAGIEDKNSRAGATARALNEQMKALGAQFTLFRNRINAAAVEAGTKLIPILLDTIATVQKLASGAMPTLEHALAALAPFFENVVQVGGDLVQVARSVIEALAPLGQVIAGITATSAITALNALSTALAGVTGFLADHPGIIQAVAVAYGIHLAGAVAKAGASFAALLLDRVALGLYGAAGAADTAAASFSTMRGVMTGLATAAIVVGFLGLINVLQGAKKHAEDAVAALGRGLDMTQAADLSEYQKRLRAATDEMLRSEKTSGGWVNALKASADVLPFVNTGVNDATKELEKYGDESERASIASLNIADNLGVLAKKTGLPSAELKKLAQVVGADLTGSLKESAPEREKIIDHLKELETQSGTSAEALKGAAGMDIAAMEALSASIEDVRKKTADAFASSTDFIRAFRPDAAEVSTQAVVTAKDDLVAAQRALEDLTARQSAGTEQTIAEQQQLAAAKAKVAEATDKVRDAESKVVSAGGQITKFYEDQVRLTSRFADDLTKAAAKGLDPDVMKRLLLAGPEQAAPILEALVGDHSGRLIAMVNESEEKLRAINGRIVEFSRLTQLAVSSETDEMARNLATAMKIAAENMAQGAAATAESIARAIGVPTEHVMSVARQYGITVAGAINTGLRSIKVSLSTEQLAAAARDTASIIANALPKILTGPSTAGGAGLNQQAALSLTQPGTATNTTPTPEQIRALQTAINTKAGSRVVAVDGILGPATRAAANTYDTHLRVGGVQVAHGGGRILGSGEVPTILEAGEYVIRKEAVRNIGTGALDDLNRMHTGGPVGHRHSRLYSDRTAWLQASLKAAGYDPGPIDGIYGPRTAAAAAASARGARPAPRQRPIGGLPPGTPLNPNNRDPFAMGQRPPNPHFAGEVGNSGMTAVEAARYGYRPVDYSLYKPAYDRYPTITLRSGAVIPTLRPGGRDPFVRTYDSGGALPPGLTMAFNGTGRTERVVTAASDDALVAELRGLRADLKMLDRKVEIHQENNINGAELPTEAALDYASHQLGFRLSAIGRA